MNKAMERRVLLNGERPGHITVVTPWCDSLGLETIMTRDEAIELVARASGRTPADWLSWTHLGTALHIVGNSKGGLAAAERALEIERNALTLLNVAVILEGFGRFSEAFLLAEEAIQRDPTHQFAGLLWAQGLLRQGRWEEGWRPFEWYSWGTMWEDELGQLIPKWEGEDLNGKRILVFQNGGFGDNLMFMRWLENLKQASAHVTYACPDVMVPLLEGHPWIDRLLPTREGYEGADTPDLPEVDVDIIKDGVPQYDYFIPMMGLAMRFNARVDDKLWTGPYIKARGRCEEIQRNHQPIVGVCWSGAEKLDPRRHRSLNTAQAKRLLDIPGIDWVSLQYDILPPSPIQCPKISNWVDSAAIIECCDIIVTVDTGVMHLAGAMDKKCFVILPGLSDWKFLLVRNDSPFYPSLQLFRNDGEGLENALTKVIQVVKEYACAL